MKYKCSSKLIFLSNSTLQKSSQGTSKMYALRNKQDKRKLQNNLITVLLFSMFLHWNMTWLLIKTLLNHLNWIPILQTQDQCIWSVTVQIPLILHRNQAWSTFVTKTVWCIVGTSPPLKSFHLSIQFCNSCLKIDIFSS